MNLFERITTRILTWHIMHGSSGRAREVFDHEYRDRPEEWRRDIWREAAERAQRKVSR